MRRGLQDFAGKAHDAEMALVFFAGHGIEMGGENYLVPVDASLRSDREPPGASHLRPARRRRDHARPAAMTRERTMAQGVKGNGCRRDRRA